MDNVKRRFLPVRDDIDYDEVSFVKGCVQKCQGVGDCAYGCVYVCVCVIAPTSGGDVFLF